MKGCKHNEDSHEKDCPLHDFITLMSKYLIDNMEDKCNRAKGGEL